ncbi:hypothetical protein BGZ61DRAFT_490655 [Ilyonectria robusta]|uniref:uncharacterized protein n=1 Tax=Ilyonectria robusta TaxID=1079257 RepID=UPI001E8E0DC5|nr:uncharacterized protein BGZ61DRAFT_490655 [Ilyonectria robusta]KAH8734797.1 hypothetical protein BGZ61DRAFT_490655 [Ilyonectria robusta]
MAPIRRYLRISKYSVLECRIYLDNPALAQSWLLNSRKPILPQVIESIRPLVLPKLREEKERSKKKSTKKKVIKDVVATDDFEVSIFLMETAIRHSLLSKTKHFREKLPPRMESNSTKLISETDRTAVDVDADDYAPAVRVEEDDDDIGLADIPAVDTVRRSKRQRQRPGRDDDDDIDGDASDEDETASAIEIDSDTEAPPHKRRRGRAGLSDETPDEDDDKKKLAMDVSYEGFAIYGQVLCLVVKKRDGGKTPLSSNRASGAAASGSVSGSRPEGQAMMENWISSTQMPVGDEVS